MYPTFPSQDIPQSYSVWSLGSSSPFVFLRIAFVSTGVHSRTRPRNRGFTVCLATFGRLSSPASVSPLYCATGSKTATQQASKKQHVSTGITVTDEYRRENSPPLQCHRRASMSLKRFEQKCPRRHHSTIAASPRSALWNTRSFERTSQYHKPQPIRTHHPEHVWPAHSAAQGV